MARLTSISPHGVVTMGKPTHEDSSIEMEKIRFIVLRKLLGVKGRFRLGLSYGAAGLSVGSEERLR